MLLLDVQAYGGSASLFLAFPNEVKTLVDDLLNS